MTSQPPPSPLVFELVRSCVSAVLHFHTHSHCGSCKFGFTNMGTLNMRIEKWWCGDELVDANLPNVENEKAGRKHARPDLIIHCSTLFSFFQHVEKPASTSEWTKICALAPECDLEMCSLKYHRRVQNVVPVICRISFSIFCRTHSSKVTGFGSISNEQGVESHFIFVVNSVVWHGRQEFGRAPRKDGVQHDPTDDYDYWRLQKELSQPQPTNSFHLFCGGWIETLAALCPNDAENLLLGWHGSFDEQVSAKSCDDSGRECSKCCGSVVTLSVGTQM